MRFVFACSLAAVAASMGSAGDVLKPINTRFTNEEFNEIPDFQRHVLPLLGKAGCNGRSCHGSFQGAGGFRLSLFGYDFKADHDALLKAEGDKEPRVDLSEPMQSKMLRKATLKMPHKGGERIKQNSWEYLVLLKWIEAGAKQASSATNFKQLEVTPKEIKFSKPGEKVQLNAIVTWSDGTREDVTCLCRFRTNDESIATVTDDGVVVSAGKGDTHVVTFYDNGVEPVVAMLPVSEKRDDKYPTIETPTRVDVLVVEKLKKLGIVPSEVCTDAEFLRRVSLDMTGTLPTPKEIEAFLKDNNPKKRAKKIDELLERPAYAAWWTTRLCDVTGQSLQQMVENNPQFSRAQYRAWYDWIYVRIRDNVPYDKIVEGIVLARGRDPGQSYEDYAKEMAALARGDKSVDFTKRDTMPFYWARRNVARPQDKALNFAYAFLGVRLQCAECHKHPFDQWTQTDFNQFAAFFNAVSFNYSPEGQKHQREFVAKYDLNDPKKKTQRDRNAAIKEAIEKDGYAPVREVFIDQRRNRPARKQNGKNRAAAAGRVITPRVLGGEDVVINDYSDPREPLMEWMRSESNPYFAKSIVNRVWANYFNVGIVDPPDDMNLANPPSNQALLDYLATGFIESGYDLKWLHRTICNSHAYQRSWKPNETNELDTRNFSRAVIRRLPAEVTYDALVLSTANTDETKQFQENLDERMIGCPMPQGGRRGQNTFAMRIFGKPDRATSCDCERMNEPTLVQSLYLRNDVDMKNLLDRRTGWLAAVALARGQEFDSTPAPVADGGKGRGKAKQRGELKPMTPDERIAALEARIARLKKGKGPKNAAEQIKQLQKQLKDARQQAAQQKSAVKTVVGGGQNINALIREAYLRTLSRPPTKDEIELARTYLNESRSPVSGLRDLMWVLVNTKEFITNH